MHRLRLKTCKLRALVRLDISAPIKYVPDIRLILYIFIHDNNDVTQKKFRFRVLVMRHLRMAVMHLPTKFCSNSSIQFGVIDIFRNPRWRPPPSWIFWPFWHVDSAVFVFCTKLVQIYVIVRRSFDDVTRINSRFRLLVTWSSPHGRGASYHVI